MNKIIVKNPRTGEALKELTPTSPSDVPQIYASAAAAQKQWAQTSVKDRNKKLSQLKDHLIRNQERVIKTVHEENGKPRIEALMHELIPIVSVISFLLDEGEDLLSEEEIPLRIMKHRRSIMIPEPLGTALVISPWNFPFSIPFSAVLMSIYCGNAVVFKPSEVTPLTGLLIQTLLDEVGIPKNLVQTVIGDGSIGPALIDAKPAKIFFTGSVATGKKIMSHASQYLIPVNLELGGKDPMVILSDANLDFTSSAALWGGYFNNGQACASVERIIVHESVADDFTKQLKDKLNKLRFGKQDSEDLGPVTMPKQAQVYEKQLEQAHAKKLNFLVGGEIQTSPLTMKPTLVTGSQIENSEIYEEETFGPAIALTTFKTLDEAITKANSLPYGLCASVFSENLPLAHEVARKIEAGTVNINEVAYTHGIAEVPWGGMKDSGFGKSHSKWGLHEFVQWKHIHFPKAGIPRFKSFWWFPYSDQQFKTFQSFLNTFQTSTAARVKSALEMVWNFVRFIRTEKRL